MTLYLVCKLSRKEETINKKSYTFFITSHKEKSTYQLTFFKPVVVGCISLLKPIAKLWWLSNRNFLKLYKEKLLIELQKQ